MHTHWIFFFIIYFKFSQYNWTCRFKDMDDYDLYFHLLSHFFLHLIACKYGKFKNDAIYTFCSVTLFVCAHVHSVSRVRLFATPWTVACQAPLSMGF